MYNFTSNIFIHKNNGLKLIYVRGYTKHNVQTNRFGETLQQPIHSLAVLHTVHSDIQFFLSINMYSSYAFH